MTEIELEKTYLVKELPKDLKNYPSKELVDIYIPEKAEHPNLRIRKKGSTFEITKKQPIKNGDASEQTEHTIKLTPEEFESLSKLPSKKVSKIRYAYVYKGLDAEIDVFTGDLKGLVLADFEFTDPKVKNSFKMPDFCLVDVTQEKIFAGGMICGKKYSDIELELKKFGYKAIK